MVIFPQHQTNQRYNNSRFQRPNGDQSRNQQRSRNQQKHQNNFQQRNSQQQSFVPNQFMIPQQQMMRPLQQMMVPKPYLPVFNTMPMQMPQQQMMVPSIYPPVTRPRNLNAKAREFTPSQSMSEINANGEKEYKEQKE